MIGDTRLDVAVLDTSAIFSVFEAESSAPAFVEGFDLCDRLLISAGTLGELSILMTGRAGLEGTKLLDDFLHNFDVEVVAVDLHTIRGEFRSGFVRWGKGMRSAAGSNFGDLFAYALARTTEAALFYQGLDFSRTDVPNAMQILGFPLNDKGQPRLPGTGDH